ncbi:hypothetical protein PV327_011218 [Microctonus hyperodae]|uniref:Uncharacterized protein n=1 Tax=Microctonus hyperodae TaxID=165561 RepID=A0AA39KRU1_MICHY|nr:hypothetical protein PV327_011218 [Microctonus hyperodae]
MRRDNWTPIDGAHLCKDGWKKLKPNAVPTLFDIPNSPPMIGPPPRKTVYKHFGYATLDGRTMKDDWDLSEDDLGDKAFLVLVKSVKYNWKQMIACHITRKGWEQSMDKPTA